MSCSAGKRSCVVCVYTWGVSVHEGKKGWRRPHHTYKQVMQLSELGCNWSNNQMLRSKTKLVEYQWLTHIQPRSLTWLIFTTAHTLLSVSAWVDIGLFPALTHTSTAPPSSLWRPWRRAWGRSCGKQTPSSESLYVFILDGLLVCVLLAVFSQLCSSLNHSKRPSTLVFS